MNFNSQEFKCSNVYAAFLGVEVMGSSLKMSGASKTEVEGAKKFNLSYYVGDLCDVALISFICCSRSKNTEN